MELYTAQPLPFYTEKPLQNIRRRWCKSDTDKFQLVVLKTNPFGVAYIPAFQVKRQYSLADSLSIQLWDFDNDVSLVTIADFPAVTTIEPLDDKPTPDYEAICFPGIPLATAYTSMIPNKHYFLKLTDGDLEWFSETFVFVDPDGEYPPACNGYGWIQLNWSNSGKTIKDYYSGAGASFSLFIPSELTRPTYKEKIDANEDGNGRARPTFIRLEKAYSFEFFAPEYIVDALRTLPAFSVVSLTTSDGINLADLHDFEFEIEWPSPGCWARVTVRFVSGAILKGSC
jgi:hypothetical protein